MDPEIPPGRPLNENDAKKYLLKTGILPTHRKCPRCGSTAVRPAPRNTFRCRDCGHTWGIKEGSILKGSPVSLRVFVHIVHLFSEDIPANEAAHRIGISSSTVTRIYSRIRMAVLENPPSCTGAAAGPAKPAGTSSRPPGNRHVVFGIRSTNGTTAIEPVTPGRADMIAGLPVPKMIEGNILFIDAYGEKYRGFIAYIPDRRGQETVIVRSHDSGAWSPLRDFWDFAEKTWARHRDMDRQEIPVFVQELAFRYNNRHADLFQTVLRHITAAR
jgi:Transposase and inactivated derivatives